MYVSPTLLGRAYRDVDPALLTDVALQLAEGERILLRSRKGITAAQALQLAVKAAGDKQHKASLERLIRFAEERKDQALAAQIAAAQKLAAASRGATACLMLPVERRRHPGIPAIRYCVQKIDRAKLTGDARCLEALEKDLDTCIPERFWDDTRKRIGEARGTIPKNGDINEPLIGFLSRLAATSRYDPERSSDEEDDTADEPVEVSGSY